MKNLKPKLFKILLTLIINSSFLTITSATTFALEEDKIEINGNELEYSIDLPNHLQIKGTTEDNFFDLLYDLNETPYSSTYTASLTTNSFNDSAQFYQSNNYYCASFKENGKVLGSLSVST